MLLRTITLTNLPALQLLPARFAAACLLQMARLTLQLLLSANAPLLNKEWAFGAASVVGVAVMVNRWMAALWSATTVESTLWGSGAARLRRLEHSSAAIAADFVENSFRTGCAWAAMANLLAVVASALQLPSTRTDTDVLCFHCSVFSRHSVLASSCLSLGSFLFTRAAVLAALVPSTAHVCLASPQTHGRTDDALMAH